MCGIVGAFSFGPEPVEAAQLARMNDLMTHRGPDAAGSYLSPDRKFGFAMRRLKVIDLATGDQPIHDGGETSWIIFNGEIYNYRELRAQLETRGHRFSTRSDTEVILHQYLEDGEKCLDSFAGMFAFAIYDARRKSLFIARDRLGVKPLFYHSGPRGFLFASEIKPLLESPWLGKGLDLQALSHYLSLNYLPQPWTPFQEIRQLPPGHWMRVEGGKTEIRPYWDAPLEGPLDESEEAALKKVGELLHRSIERRLIADVPLGAFLSGGLDSSTLVALMKEHRQGAVKTFSVGFSDAAYDETPHARAVARYFGTDHYEITCSSDDVARHLPDVAWHADNLLADQACLSLYLVSRLAKEHVTVSLSGDGGDEVFVGYPTFLADHYHSLYSRLPGFIREGLVEPLVRALPSSDGKLSFEYRARKFVEAGGFGPEKAHYWWRTIFTETEKRDLLRPEIREKISSLDAFPVYEEHFRRAAGLPFGESALYADLKVWLAGNNLYKVDSMTMAHGLEARVPFLDHELVEYLSRLPMRLKFKGRVLKYLQKKWLKGKLPEPILKRKKAGWHAPIAAWFRGPLKPYLEKTLLSGHPVWDPVFRAETIGRILSEHARGARNHSFKIWGLLVLFHWADRVYGPARGKEELAVR
ncbi:MAG: asparagine synthase (glutamine-hydrolyzing) [Candidatus Omnitrophica bacterium]|nr:asparagine synthase (glutamine-hydrolyzing) [Candidatus Omnitrophota bacterium]